MAKYMGLKVVFSFIVFEAELTLVRLMAKV